MSHASANIIGHKVAVNRANELRVGTLYYGIYLVKCFNFQLICTISDNFVSDCFRTRVGFYHQGDVTSGTDVSAPDATFSAGVNTAGVNIRACWLTEQYN